MMHMITTMVGINVLSVDVVSEKGDMDIDHIIPQKYGGRDSVLNLQCICKHCNRSKQASLRDTPKDLFGATKRKVKSYYNN